MAEEAAITNFDALCWPAGVLPPVLSVADELVPVLFTAGRLLPAEDRDLLTPPRPLATDERERTADENSPPFGSTPAPPFITPDCANAKGFLTGLLSPSFTRKSRSFKLSFSESICGDAASSRKLTSPLFTAAPFTVEFEMMAAVSPNCSLVPSAENFATSRKFGLLPVPPKGNPIGDSARLDRCDPGAPPNFFRDDARPIGLASRLESFLLLLQLFPGSEDPALDVNGTSGEAGSALDADVVAEESVGFNCGCATESNNFCLGLGLTAGGMMLELLALACSTHSAPVTTGKAGGFRSRAATGTGGGSGPTGAP
mmetsp:Transcript_14195/g.35236  ORF Transcript_14195/g.35236 Transcript_14195/m.35236 type:complete len:314 (-) Transcript_14195:1427-2368(-)